MPFKSCKGSCLRLFQPSAPAVYECHNVKHLKLQEFCMGLCRAHTRPPAHGDSGPRNSPKPPHHHASFLRPAGWLEGTDLRNGERQKSGHPTRLSKHLSNVWVQGLLPGSYKTIFNGTRCFAPYVPNIRFSVLCGPPCHPHTTTPQVLKSSKKFSVLVLT